MRLEYRPVRRTMYDIDTDVVVPQMTDLLINEYHLDMDEDKLNKLKKDIEDVLTGKRSTVTDGQKPVIKMIESNLGISLKAIKRSKQGNLFQNTWRVQKLSQGAIYCNRKKH